MIRNHFSNVQVWLAARLPLLTASDIATTIDENPWRSIDDLYNEKTGLVAPKDISDKACIVYGKEAEQHIRGLFALENVGVYDVEYFPFDIITHATYPFLGATLDGELTYLGEKRTVRSATGFIGTLRNGFRGVYEVKTSTVRSKDELCKWDDQIPTNYFAQHCLQLFVTGYQFGIVDARILLNEREIIDGEWVDSAMPTIHTRRYFFFYGDPVVRHSMTRIVSAGIKVAKCIEECRRPELVIK